MANSNSNAVWFITGTSSGLGKAIAEKVLLMEGATVYGFSRKKTIRHPRYHHHYIDFSQVEDVKNISFEYDVKQPEHIILINNAGTLGKIKKVGEQNESDIVDTYHVNLISPHVLMNKFIERFNNIKDVNVCVINVTSGAAKTPYDGWSSYCATKSGLDMLTLCAAKEQLLQVNPIRIFALAPGVMDTQMQQQIRETPGDDFSNKNKFVELHKNKELYQVQDVAEKYIQLALDTGTTQETIQRVVL